MLLFLDTEFTNFMQPRLISLALVGEGGFEFYAECNDFSIPTCSSFVRATVLPLLGRVRGAACDEGTLMRRLRKWFEALPETAMVICDYGEDEALLMQAVVGREFRSPPEKLGQILVLDTSIISDPIFDSARKLAFSEDWPPHHALADARALHAGYRAWRTRDGEQHG